MLSKIDSKEVSDSSKFFYPVFISLPLISTPLTSLAWCSDKNNKISVIDLEYKQNYVTFDGARISETGSKYQILR